LCALVSGVPLEGDSFGKAVHLVAYHDTSIGGRTSPYASADHAGFSGRQPPFLMLPGAVDWV
jgi:hypothetical protein